MQGLILAAGMGKRLKELTQNNTKCMIKVNGVTLIERMLRQLDSLSLTRVVIVVGYEGQKLIDFISTLDIKTEICYVDNPIYDKTNNIYSLALAKEYLLIEDTLLLESDLIFEDSLRRTLVSDPRDTLALVDKYESWMDGTVIKVDTEDNIIDFVPGKKFVFEDIKEYYKTVNIYKFSRHFSETHYVPFLDAYSKALGNNEYYEQVLRVITMLDDPQIKAKRLEGQLWYEIDDIQDLDIASSIFAESEDEKVALIQNRYGGYWRYPKMLDFCYLVNPYFPPQKLVDEMKANFERLLTQYPSGMRVNSLLAAKNFGVSQDHIAVGNGAAELIKGLMDNREGKVGFIRPTFEEYPNRYRKEESVELIIKSDDFTYSSEDVINYFSETDIKTLVLINPDNPSGNYIQKAGVLEIAEWSNKRGISLIIDESFVDFSDEEDSSLINEDILSQYNNLIVVKSISKSYGVPGLRLGIAASGNNNVIERLKKDVSIWNINSFAEFYMQIEEKYKKAYKEAIDRFKIERHQFMEDLSKIDGIIVIPSQANYFMIEIANGRTSKEITKKLLLQDNIFVKDLSSKVKTTGRQFIRIAIKRESENKLLLNALKKILNN